jgi:hypothetical protein
MMPKRAKTEVDYSKGMPTEHCGRRSPNDQNACKHFLPLKTVETGHCELVEGQIERNYWCKLWERA